MAKAALAAFVISVLSSIAEARKYACDSQIYCQGPVLEAVQSAGIFPDSKTFVDMSMKYSPDEILSNFTKLTDRSDHGLKEFVRGHFSGPGDELEVWTPSDWQQECGILQSKVSDPKLRNWVGDLNALWKILGRKMKDDVQSHPDRHSLLYVPNPFIIPGDRFREFYYWDSYWILNGLMLCNMTDTAKGMLENLLHYVDSLGHVPNGGRVYYVRRSQPPLLIPMVQSYYQATSDVKFIEKNLHLLEEEYSFWLTNRTVHIKSPRSGLSHNLARYTVDMDQPRPEGYIEDIHIANQTSVGDHGRVYSDLAAAAESGWDFSSRWFAGSGPHKHKLEGIQTSNNIPVDLNSFLCLNEQLLSQFYHLLNNTHKAEMFQKRARARELAIHDLLWNSTQGAWFDLDLDTGKQRTWFYPSNLFPMFAGCYGNLPKENKMEMTEKVLEYLEREGIPNYLGGIPSSKIPTGQQWDGDNAWAPNVHMVVEGLANSGIPAAQEMALQLAQNWVENNYKTYRKYHAMFEKYDAANVGVPGGGGEYTVQIGFGWTNGIALMLLDRYGDQLQAVRSKGLFNIFIGSSSNSTASTIIIITASVLILGVGLLLVVCAHRYARSKRREPEKSTNFQNVEYLMLPGNQPR